MFLWSVHYLKRAFPYMFTLLHNATYFFRAPTQDIIFIWKCLRLIGRGELWYLVQLIIWFYVLHEDSPHYFHKCVVLQLGDCINMVLYSNDAVKSVYGSLSIVSTEVAFGTQQPIASHSTQQNLKPSCSTRSFLQLKWFCFQQNFLQSK